MGIGRCRSMVHLEVAKCDLKIRKPMARRTKSTEVIRAYSDAARPSIYSFRGESVVLDHDVARLFGVETKRLNEQVSRNQEKFRDDFAFRLTREEFEDLRSQNATSSDPGWGGTRYPPRAFTEHGVVMAATILKSPQAIEATRFVVRTFVQARHATISKRRKSKVDGDDYGQLPLALEMRTSLMTKLNDAMGHVLDAMIDPTQGTTVRDEARAIAAEGMNGLKDLLKKPGIQNEKTLAEVRKIMAEAESIEVATDGKRTENKERQLALIAKKLRLIFEAHQFIETGSADGLMKVLAALEQPKLPPS